ncbi:hypothetical protein RM549_15740 [Salegentibacter sp. F188]|uniref:Uncharacterized protein n=1 Tax=Autumnicola patrickiae TaxID=3075591 RepID=A0ABU3E5I1_9FLAO|nr:hypothetical protein [Salegentibacter sp. F188]MDT0691248.1 hypothetical protein [Salegentibacter sp. F188]
MRCIILIISLLAFNILSAQAWKHKSSENAFDGKYRIASVTGTGNDYPYHKPTLVINLVKENLLNFYIADAGYYQSVYDIEIFWVFDNEPNLMYLSRNLSKSPDGKIIFLDDFKNTNTGEYFHKLEFIEKLKSANKVDVRIKNRFGKNDIVFPLSGSTQSINFVISKEFKNKEIAEQEKIREIAEQEIQKAIEERKKILMMFPYDLLGEPSSKMLEKIDEYSELYDFELSDIDSLNLKPDKLLDQYVKLNLFDKNNNIIKSISFRDVVPDDFRKNLVKKEEDFDKKTINTLLQDYDLTDKEKEFLKKEIANPAGYTDFEIKDLDSIHIDFSQTGNRRLFKKIDFLNKANSVIYSVPSVMIQIYATSTASEE